MEGSNNARANKMLRFVIWLCLAAVVVVTLITANARREDKSPLKEQDSVQHSSAVSEESSKEASKHEQKTSEDRKKKESSSLTEKETSIVSTELDSSKSEKTGAAISTVEEKESFDLPVNGSITKEYSVETPVYSITMNDYRAHTGIDIACDEGAAVGASASGIVRSIVNDPMMGTSLKIEHADGVCTYYMNLSESLPNDITVGAVVDKGQLLGAVGSSAIVEIASEPHLHFEMTVSDLYVDPLTMIKSDSVSVISENIVD